jgi:hypothetical protein
VRELQCEESWIVRLAAFGCAFGRRGPDRTRIAAREGPDERAASETGGLFLVNISIKERTAFFPS